MPETNYITTTPFDYRWYLKDINSFVPKSNLKAFGTFVCGGGTTMGAKLAGLNHLGGVELLKNHIKYYNKNLNPKYSIQMDINKFNTSSIIQEVKNENIDILEGSPPCKSFSTSGKGLKGLGIPQNYNGVMQLNDDLIASYANTINIIKPKVFTMENVKGLLTKGMNSYINLFKNMIKNDYKIQVFLLNAKYMGVPQSRERVFIVGQRNDMNFPKLNLNFNINQIILKEILDQCSHDSTQPPLAPFTYKIWNEIRYPEVTSHEKYFNSIRPSINKPCCTLLASYKNIFHPTVPRHLSIEEIKLVSSFPKDYEGGYYTTHKLAGRSVPPVMAANIFYQIRKQWFKDL